jgi:small subunit ribosomal protein S1
MDPEQVNGNAEPAQPEDQPVIPEDTSAEVETPSESLADSKESFKDMLEDFNYQIPERGSVMQGTILRIDEDAIIVDVGLKRDAVVPQRDLSSLDRESLKGLNVGDKVTVYVTNTPEGDQDLLVSLARGIEQGNWDEAEQYMENGTILELEVVDENKGGVLVRFNNLRGFVPASQVPDLRRLNDRQRLYRLKQNMIGSTLPVKVIEVDRHRNRLVFSAAAAMEEQRRKRMSELQAGQVFRQARVVSVVNFGIFVDLDGVDGMVHLSQLDWKTVSNPASMFKPGDKIDVQVLEVNLERERISLSRKALLANPWEQLQERYRPGDVVQGVVTRLADFGAFVRIEEGVEGLVHVSELGYSSGGKPEEVVSIGEEVLVRILDINPKRERLSLSMRRVSMDKQITWMAAKASPESGTSAPDAPEEAGEAEDVEDVVEEEEIAPAADESEPQQDSTPEADEDDTE